jgi:hypothetical protein
MVEGNVRQPRLSNIDMVAEIMVSSHSHAFPPENMT